MNPFDYPLLVLAISLPLFWGAARLGGKLRKALPDAAEARDEDFSFVLGGTLTLLGLLIGFTFSMAVGRYDQRKSLEEQEANAIGTAVRARRSAPGAGGGEGSDAPANLPRPPHAIVPDA